jgi:RHS repeat-associated protein
VTTGHERDTETGLDYRGARFYDSDVARFLSLDPLAAQFPEWSAYNYVLGNPVMFVDPDGKSPDWYPEFDESTKKINLVAESGDNLETLKTWSNGLFSDFELSSLYKNRDKSSGEHGKIDLSETSIGNFTQGFLAKQKDFNCFSSVVNGLSVNDNKNWGDSDQDTFEEFLSSNDYTKSTAVCYSTKNCNILKDIGGGFLMYNAKPFETAFGYTMKDSDEDFYGDGTLDYVSIFVGNDSQGTPWILTKDGYDSVYQFQKGANSNYDGSLPDTIYQKID